MKKLLLIVLALLFIASCTDENSTSNTKNSEENHLSIDDRLVRNYLNGYPEDLSSEWFFKGRRLHQGLPTDSATTALISSTFEQMRKTLSNFEPTNKNIIDTLFPNWRDEKLNIDIIVGFPKPFDAVTDIDPQGTTHIILDVKQFADYELDDESMVMAINNIVTHEMVHVLIGSKFPEIFSDTSYIRTLDKITFNEGFAHVLSFFDEDIETVEWDDYLTDYDSINIAELAAALKETEPEKQKIALVYSNSGQYFKKFACMSGMFYLVKRWRDGGTAALKQELDNGYDGFCEKVINY